MLSADEATQNRTSSPSAFLSAISLIRPERGPAAQAAPEPEEVVEVPVDFLEASPLDQPFAEFSKDTRTERA